MVHKRRLPSCTLVLSKLPKEDGGGLENKNFFLLKALSSKYTVRVIYITPFFDFLFKSDPENGVNLLEGQSIIKVRQSFFGLIRSLINLKLPIECALYFDPKVAFFLEDSRNDFIFFSLLRTISIYPVMLQRRVPIFCCFADLRWIIYERKSRCARSLCMRFLLKLESWRCRKYESSIIRLIDFGFLFNAGELQQISGMKNVRRVQHGCSEAIRRDIDSEGSEYGDLGRYLVLFGRMDVSHNRSALEWLDSQVMQYLPSHIRLVVVGSGFSSNDRNKLQTKRRIIFLGHVTNPGNIFSNALYNLCPVFEGGGIQNKIIEALKCGGRVLASTNSAEPFLENPEMKRFIDVADDPKVWVKVIREVAMGCPLSEEEKVFRESVIRRNFSWEGYGENILSAISES